jgi:hypothetical protein
MKYYAGHESTYRRLEEEGASCWDRTAFDAFTMRRFLDRARLRRCGFRAHRRLRGASERPISP